MSRERSKISVVNCEFQQWDGLIPLGAGGARKSKGSDNAMRYIGLNANANQCRGGGVGGGNMQAVDSTAPPDPRQSLYSSEGSKGGRRRRAQEKRLMSTEIRVDFRRLKDRTRS